MASVFLMKLPYGNVYKIALTSKTPYQYVETYTKDVQVNVDVIWSRAVEDEQKKHLKRNCLAKVKQAGAFMLSSDIFALEGELPDFDSIELSELNTKPNTTYYGFDDEDCF